MMLHPLFVAGVLEGFEGTLDEVVGRVENSELNAQVDALRSQVAALRMRFEACLDQDVDGRVGASPDVSERKEARLL
jgi:outer membrane murein-binding lipoprotein Lpp